MHSCTGLLVSVLWDKQANGTFRSISRHSEVTMATPTGAAPVGSQACQVLGADRIEEMVVESSQGPT